MKLFAGPEIHAVLAWPVVVASNGRSGMLGFPFCTGNCRGFSEPGVLSVAYWSELLLVLDRPANGNTIVQKGGAA
jgi:hypothetical protein